LKETLLLHYVRMLLYFEMFTLSLKMFQIVGCNKNVFFLFGVILKESCVMEGREKSILKMLMIYHYEI